MSRKKLWHKGEGQFCCFCGSRLKWVREAYGKFKGAFTLPGDITLCCLHNPESECLLKFPKQVSYFLTPIWLCVTLDKSLTSLSFCSHL